MAPRVGDNCSRWKVWKLKEKSQPEERFGKATKSHDDAKKSFVYYFMMCLDEMFKVVTRLKKILGSQRNVTMMLRKALWISMTYKKELEIFFRFRKSQFGKKSSDQKDDSDDANESFVNKINLQEKIRKDSSGSETQCLKMKSSRWSWGRLRE